MQLPLPLATIFEKFQGRLVGNEKMKYHVCDVLFHMPADIIDFITAQCWFMASMEDAWAFTFTGNDLKNQHLIFLSDELLQQDIHQIHYSIAHEIGHVILRHRNSTLVKQTPEEIEIQEKEADAFAEKYI
ncbi:MAG TPA: M48 family metalloprotease [Candidatus Saccharimonadales bacterium]|nr:M48 family metalloprotease [Candidatus Saccharimonadales bacterium]